MTNTLAQRKSPLTQQQREIIAAVATKCDDFNITANDVWTIRINEVGVLWVHLYDGRQLPFNCDQFRAAIQQLKSEVTAEPQTPGLPVPKGLQPVEVYYRNHWVQIWKLHQRNWATYGHLLLIDTSINRIIGMVQSRSAGCWEIATERRDLYLGLATA